MKERSSKIVNGLILVTIFVKSSILNVGQVSTQIEKTDLFYLVNNSCKEGL